MLITSFIYVAPLLTPHPKRAIPEIRQALEQETWVLPSLTVAVGGSGLQMNLARPVGRAFLIQSPATSLPPEVVPQLLCRVQPVLGQQIHPVSILPSL